MTTHNEPVDFHFLAHQSAEETRFYLRLPNRKFYGANKDRGPAYWPTRELAEAVGRSLVNSAETLGLLADPYQVRIWSRTVTVSASDVIFRDVVGTEPEQQIPDETPMHQPAAVRCGAVPSWQSDVTPANASCTRLTPHHGPHSWEPGTEPVRCETIMNGRRCVHFTNHDGPHSVNVLEQVVRVDKPEKCLLSPGDLGLKFYRMVPGISRRCQLPDTHDGKHSWQNGLGEALVTQQCRNESFGGEECTYAADHDGEHSWEAPRCDVRPEPVVGRNERFVICCVNDLGHEGLHSWVRVPVDIGSRDESFDD